MIKIIKVCAVSVLVLSGCATGPAIDPVAVMGRSSCPWYELESWCTKQDWEQDLAKKWNRRYLEEDGGRIAKILKDYASSATSEQDKYRLRNDYIHEMFAIIDEEQLHYQNSIRQTKAFSDFFMDLSVLGLTAAGSVVGGAPTKAILSAAAAALTGTKIAVDKAFFEEAAVSSILNHMDSARNTSKLHIRTKMRQEVADYPLSEARSDLLEYLFSGSIITAVKSIAEDSAIKKKESVDKLGKTTNRAPELSIDDTVTEFQSDKEVLIAPKG